MITSTVTVLLLIALGLSGGSGRGECPPNITYYAPYPRWFPQYLGPTSYTDYQVVRYLTSPAETAAIVKQRIRTLHAANPALLPTPKESLPPPSHLPSP